MRPPLTAFDFGVYEGPGKQMALSAGGAALMA
jgi:hypothetical protein